MSKLLPPTKSCDCILCSWKVQEAEYYFTQGVCEQHLAEEEMSRAVVFVQANNVIDWNYLRLVPTTRLPRQYIDGWHPESGPARLSCQG